jgi:hypothetical protein
MDRTERRPCRGFASTATLAAAALGVLAPRASATWSIMMHDARTHEIAVGGATCVTGIDLKGHLPVILVDRAAACAQALVDVFGTNRLHIRDRLLENAPPAVIIEELADIDSAHQRRQYGIVAGTTPPATFSGNETFAFSGGLTGSTGSINYAIQGNILTGEPVILAAEQALLDTPGGLPEKLMAAMEAARAMGGDGRCSCPDGPQATSCGSPPANFEKSAHVGFMIATRTGDTDGGCNADDGCATGDYFMDFNFPFRGQEEADPVISLREAFDPWFADLIGWPDAVKSNVTIDPPAFPADGTGAATMTIALRDVQGDPLEPAQLDQTTVVVIHAPQSDGTTLIGPVMSAGNGLYTVSLTGTETIGRDRYYVRAEGPFRPVVLVPVPHLLSVAQADQDADGDVDRDDYQSYAACLAGPSTDGEPPCEASDLNRSGQVDFADYAVLQTQFTDSSCLALRIVQEPLSQALPCGVVLTLKVVVEADPPAVFQWALNGQPIPGATRSRYVKTLTSADDFGIYSVRVSNTCGTILVDDVQVVPRGVLCP